NDMIVRAICYALKHFPIMKSELAGESIRLRKDINIGIAVAADKGLIVPVLRHADRMKLQEISSTTTDLAYLAKTGNLKSDEYKVSTFTISNLVMFGVKSGEAILNSPETGIMMTGEIKDTPVAENGAVMSKALMVATLTYDHRVLDGATAAQFTGKFREALESPYLVM
ncbi:MAG: 2-oxo acid dehydrogenase subunit E2, partial [Clostridiaceae bacterium]|nr:2-oxo acid dehydrogenase subunit E2 [Clostridiaceae bacterium]